MSEEGANLLEIIITVFLALGSLGVSVFTFLKGRNHESLLRNQDREHQRRIEELKDTLERERSAEIEKLKDRLESQRSKEDARIDYEYEARKRLYLELEPMLLIFLEESENAYNHICELASMARWSDLAPKLSSSAEGKDRDSEDGGRGYYIRATIYNLMLPLATFRLMQRHLTSYDLQLERYFRIQYLLTKCLYFTFADNFKIAVGDKREYKTCLICVFDWLKPTRETDEKRSHPNHIPQNILGINRGIIDSLADALEALDTDDNNEKIRRIMTFDEFENRFFINKKTTEMPLAVQKFLHLFLDFNPDKEENYPQYILLWRILLVQASIYWIMKNVRQTKDLKPEYFSDGQAIKKMTVEDIIGIFHCFKKQEIQNFSWVPANEKGKIHGIRQAEMQGEFELSIEAIESYMSDLLKRNLTE